MSYVVTWFSENGKEVPMRKGRCSICGEEIIGWGHNPAPIATGRCCDICNDAYVISARMQMMFERLSLMLKPKNEEDHTENNQNGEEGDQSVS